MLVGAIHAQILVLEADLSQQHLDDPSYEVHAQTISAEPDPEAGEPGVNDVGRSCTNWCCRAGTAKGTTWQPIGKRPKER